MPSPVVSAIGSVVGGVAQAGAAGKAADAQSAAAERELQLQREIYEETSQNFDPYRQGGGLGFQAYLSEMGLADRPMIGGTAPQVVSFTEQIPGQPLADGQRPGIFDQLSNVRNTGSLAGMPPGMGPGSSRTRFRVGEQIFDDEAQAQAYARANTTGGREFGGYQETPGTQFVRSRGLDAINSSGAARGNYLSGSNVAGAVEFNQGLSDQGYNAYLNRLQGIGQQGQAAAGNQAAAGQAYAAGAGNALSGIGNAQAAGAIGQGNAFSGMIDNLSGTYGYLNSQRPQTQQPGGNNWLFGGNSWG